MLKLSLLLLLFGASPSFALPAMEAAAQTDLNPDDQTNYSVIVDRMDDGSYQLKLIKSYHGEFSLQFRAPNRMVFKGPAARREDENDPNKIIYSIFGRYELVIDRSIPQGINATLRIGDNLKQIRDAQWFDLGDMTAQQCAHALLMSRPTPHQTAPQNDFPFY